MCCTYKVDDVEQSPEHAAEAFNNYFLNITENLNIHIAKDNPISLLSISISTHADSSYYKRGDKKYNHFPKD